MNDAPQTQPTASDACMAFAGQTCIAIGPLAEVALAAKRLLDDDSTASVLVLDAETSEPMEVDFRGAPAEVVAKLPAMPAMPAPSEGFGAPARPAAPGRPRLGVVAREVTLLPRHWQWLSEQPGGASVTLRKLVEEARRSTADEVRVRRSREVCYRFMTVLAGNEPGFEEALRALFAGGRERFEALTERWPPDVRDHARRLAAGSFTE